MTNICEHWVEKNHLKKEVNFNVTKH